MNIEIKVLRPACIASLAGFGLGLSMTMKPYGTDYGASYFAMSLMVSITYSVIAFFTVLAWQGTRRYLTKPTGGKTPAKAKPGLFSVIVSVEDALAAVRVTAWLIIVMSGFAFSIRLFVGNVWVGVLGAVIVAGLAAIVLRQKSRAAAVVLLLLSIVGAFATGHNKFFGGEGGANLFIALLVAWASARLVFATFRLQSNRTSKPKVSSPESVVPKVAADPSRQNLSAEARLIELRQLFEKGLITQAVYEQRQAEILNDK